MFKRFPLNFGVPPECVCFLFGVSLGSCNGIGIALSLTCTQCTLAVCVACELFEKVNEYGYGEHHLSQFCCKITNGAYAPLTPPSNPPLYPVMDNRNRGRQEG